MVLDNLIAATCAESTTDKDRLVRTGLPSSSFMLIVSVTFSRGLYIFLFVLNVTRIFESLFSDKSAGVKLIFSVKLSTGMSA